MKNKGAEQIICQFFYKVHVHHNIALHFSCLNQYFTVEVELFFFKFHMKAFALLADLGFGLI